MAVYKEEKTNTWRVLYRYTDWNGERKQSQKRGFKTKREAQAWEREQLNKLGGDLDMTFKSFVQHYTEDMQARIKENTWATKEHIIQTKLIPYFGKLKMCNITAQQIITWQNELINYKDDNLWKLLIDRNMNKTELKEAAGISFNVMARMGKNETISFESIEKICAALQCNIGDIIEITQDKHEETIPKTFTTIELFAGAGGLALGIEKAGFETLGLIEFDKDASDTLKCNRPNWRVINDDIANISCLDLKEYFGLAEGELDLLSGGAPCQSFSYAGKRLGLEDARGTLFYHYLRTSV